MNLHTHFAQLIRAHAAANPGTPPIGHDSLTLRGNHPQDPDGFRAAVELLLDTANRHGWWTADIHPSIGEVRAFGPVSLVGPYTRGGLQAQAQILASIDASFSAEIGDIIYSAALCSVCGAGITEGWPGDVWGGCDATSDPHQATPEQGTVAPANVWDCDDARNGAYRL